MILTLMVLGAVRNLIKTGADKKVSKLFCGQRQRQRLRFLSPTAPLTLLL